MDTRILIILSAGKADPSMISDFGEISHARIPYECKPIFFQAINTFHDFDEIYVVIDPTDHLAQNLTSLLKASIINVDGGKELSETIRTALNEISKGRVEDYSFQLLFGDTLVTPILKEDFIGVAAPQSDFHDWASIGTYNGSLRISEPGKSEEKIIAGYFGFSSAFEIQKYLKEVEFYNAVSLYFNTKSDSKMFIIDVPNWRDFGRANTYYRNRSRKQLSRNFNEVQIQNSGRTILKTSKDIDKIESEISWYLDIEDRGIAHIAPKLISYNMSRSEYELEYLPYPTVSDVYIFGEKTLGYWQRLFNSVNELLGILRVTIPIDKKDYWEASLRENYLERFDSRISLLTKQDPKLLEIKIRTKDRLVLVEELIECMKTWLVNYHPVPSGFAHGDLFFGNMFYQEKIDKLICIDPRGLNIDKKVFDFEYEFAKLFHSLIGNYDFIAADLYSLDLINDTYKLQIPLTESHRAIQKLGKEILQQTRGTQGLKPEPESNLISYLFLTLTPLHNENRSRQIAALCTAAELFDWC